MGLKFLIDILLKDTETMTDERFNHLEAQITELRELVSQSMSATQQNTEAIQHNITATQQNAAAMEHNITVMQQELNSIRQDMTNLRDRVDSIEGTVTSEIRKGFNLLRNDLDDLNLEKSTTKHNTFDEDLNQRRLNRRIPAFDKREDD
jgi:septal ring factor EnvC (AmiA/AmiB activator)